MLKEIKEIVISASKIMLDRIEIETSEKGDVANIVTSKDIKVQEFLIENLSKLGNVKFFAEESEKNELTDEPTFVIDPIDGTTNFLYDLKCSMISVAYVENKETVISVCYNPYLNEMYYAQKGEGAFLNDKRIYVSKNDFKHSLVMVGTAPYRKDLSKVTFKKFENIFLEARDLRRSGSAVFDMCALASSRVDAFYEESLCFWDYAAAYLIIKEAGGLIYLNGDFGQSNIRVFAGNKDNFDKLKEVVMI